MMGYLGWGRDRVAMDIVAETQYHVVSHWQQAVLWSKQMSNAIHPALPHLTFLVGVTIAVVILVTKCVECYVQSRRKLDQVKDDDALLADSNLRALRRALLIADIQNHPSRLLKSIKTIAKGNEFAIRDSEGMV